MMNERHQLIYLANDAMFEMYRQESHGLASEHNVYDSFAALLREHVIAWLKKGLPCIYARQLDNDVASINLGVPLIVDNKKHRVSLRVDKSAVLKVQELPKLVEMQAFFTKMGAKRAVTFDFIAVYGSFLWQYLTNDCYVSASSDLDLLIDYPGYSLEKLSQLTVLLANEFTRTIDGELRFKRIGDVSIKELLNTTSEKILVKRRNSVELLSRNVIYECYPALCSNK